MKKLLNVLAAAVLVIAVVPISSFASHSYIANKYTPEEEKQLMAEYDELFDKWVAAGLSRDDIEDKTSDWLAEKNVSMSDPLINYTDKHEMKYFGK